ncbi:MAG: peptidase glycoprotease [Deltaproteobacteria bacterium]|nr:peptidase glycoprotease [Deltaproteobacteria bacterium]
MKVLGLDTATLTAGIAVIDDGRVLAEARHDSSNRSSDLLVAVDDVCRRAGVAPTALDAIAIGAGPGSFTGLRIGMATAKGIAFAAHRPLWAVSSLAALAHDAITVLADQPRLPSDDGVIVAVLDARRGEVYAGCYRAGAPLDDERVLAPGELAAWVRTLAGERPTWFAGDALAAHPEVLAPLAEQWLAISTPSGTGVAQLALAGKRVDVLTAGVPTYIRPSEAETKYPDGVPGALRRR